MDARTPLCSLLSLRTMSSRSSHVIACLKLLSLLGSLPTPHSMAMSAVDSGVFHLLSGSQFLTVLILDIKDCLGLQTMSPSLVLFVFVTLFLPGLEFFLVVQPHQKCIWFSPPSQFSSVAQSCPTLRHPMDCSLPGLPVHHRLPEFTQTH